MDGKIRHVTLVVNDQAASLAFYTERAGFEKRTDISPPGGLRWLSVGLPGHELELVLLRPGSDPGDPTHAWKPGTSPGIMIQVPDCQKAFDELSARGVKFREPKPTPNPYSIVANFTDPDGNAFSLVQFRSAAMGK
ncbi:MAG: VOC family protein [Thermoplasmata archaeon]|nr:VOC family protein [Thermoplasmata archaeon]MCI4356929.1 VOC family protein [Thermoplasmata archaeon]